MIGVGWSVLDNIAVWGMTQQWRFGLISCCGSSNTAMDGIFQIFGEEPYVPPEYMFVVFKNVLLVWEQIFVLD